MFRTEIEKTAKTKDSNIVLALDLPFEKPENRFTLLDKAEHILKEVSTYICAVKFNHHLVLPLGTFDGVKEIIKKAHEMGLLTIMDCKLNDIGSTNEVIAEYYYAAGFDALIANPFVGWKDGLESVFGIAHNLKRGVILLTYMSHKGTIEGYGQDIYDPEIDKRILGNAWGRKR